jgi:cytochrome c oxidase subunit 3
LSESSAALAHQFEDLEQQGEASRLGMWAFLVTEVMFFGGLFTGYVLYRSSYPEAFAAGSAHLDLLLGGINTAVLIASSLTMALAVHAAEGGRRARTVFLLSATLVLGSVFLGIKAVEYAHKYQESLIPGPGFSSEGPREVQLFYSFYFAMTGMHALHMVIGVGLLSVLIYGTLRGRIAPPNVNAVDLAGLYWHFVDIVWIFLFPLLYLIGRHG